MNQAVWFLLKHLFLGCSFTNKCQLDSYDRSEGFRYSDIDCGSSFTLANQAETDVYDHPDGMDDLGGCRALSWADTGFVVCLDDGCFSFYSQACNGELCMHGAIIVCNKE